MKIEFAQNPFYVGFERNLRDLHELIAAGEGDSERADTLREAMSALYRSLSAEEEKRLNGLSEDLYTLTEPVAVLYAGHSPADAQLAEAFLRARQHDDWAAIPPLLRKLAHRFPASGLAFQRYQAYARLGHLKTAYLFLRRASELDPSDLRKQHILLDFSRKAGRAADALAQSELLLRAPETPAPLVIAAAHICFDALRNLPTEAAIPDVNEISTALEQVMRNPEALNGSPPSVAIVGHTTLGFCREKLGDIEGAMGAFDQALKLDPQSDALRVARGLVLVPHDMARAATEFRKAAELGSRLFHPYLFLAPYALGESRWQEARGYAKKLLAYAREPSIEAEAHHWLAIAEFELGTPWPEVEARFCQAQRLDPLNLRITENFERCRETRSSSEQRSTIQWSRPGPDDFPNASSFQHLEMAV